MKDLSQNQAIVITTADKGGKVVVLDVDQYSEMCMVHLEDSVYEKVDGVGTGRNRIVLLDRAHKIQQDLFSERFDQMDPCDRLPKLQCQQLTRTLDDLKRKKEISVHERKWLLPSQPYSGTLPKFYGLPKIHKLGPLLIRPIIANCGLYSDPLMLKLKSVLNLLLWGSTSLRNSYELVKLLQGTKFEQSDMLLSFDVKSLFTRVPVEDALKIIEQ
ncbi:MAG: hypothetical protein GY861_04960 [bacterium]|nr:hypothetical protein [bacterium]